MKIINILPICFVALATLVISGCQVRPLYSDAAVNTSGQVVSSALRSIVIAPPQNRTTQLVRNDLIFLLYGGQAQPDIGDFTLDISASKSVSEESVTVSTTYTLTEVATETKKAGRSLSQTVRFEELVQDFANTRAAIDAEERAAAIIAGDIRNQIAIALSR